MLSFEGLKKIGGVELYVLRYRPRKSTDDLEIRLYFDPQTYHHLETTYTGNFQAELADQPHPIPGIHQSRRTPAQGGISGTPATRSVRYLLDERFSEFKSADGITLPTHYDLQFTERLPSGLTTVFDWDVHDLEVSNNLSLDPRNFEVK